MTVDENCDKSCVKGITEIIREFKHEFFGYFCDFGKEMLNIELKVEPEILFIKSHYIKLSRELGQYDYIVKNKIYSRTSIDNEIKNFFTDFFGNSKEDLVLSCGGREDRDVRMLGSGRHFVISVQNYRNTLNPDEGKNIEIGFNKANKDVKILGLESCEKKEYEILKKCEEDKIKSYIAVIYIESPLNEEIISKLDNISNLKVMQKTPLRVIHKRVLTERTKLIYKINVTEIINSHFLVLKIMSSSGTYIKELIHGDLGRTFPSLSNILNCKCDIIQLDVVEIK